jgi:hypothetical protein
MLSADSEHTVALLGEAGQLELGERRRHLTRGDPGRTDELVGTGASVAEAIRGDAKRRRKPSGLRLMGFKARPASPR